MNFTAHTHFKQIIRLAIAFSLVVVLKPTETQAQQQVMFTQYMFNALAINPAYAGTHDAISITALGRKQWVGLDGAPSTQTLSLHSPVTKKNISLGLVLLNDKIGIFRQTGIFTSYAYRVQMGEGKYLSMGLQFGLTRLKAEFTELTTVQQGDPNFFFNDFQKFKPNFGAGLYYYSDRFYAGVSAPLLLNNFIADKVDNGGAIKERRHFFAMTGYVFDLSHSLKLKPHALLKMVEGAPVEFDLNANLIINDVLWIGASYRSLASINALLEIQLNDQLRFGYAYDFTTTDLAKVNSGSHEIMLNYRLSFSKGKIITPRYF
ncbi:MAG: type IX secretion system membrane protein PorP/SprF [Cyclobacteriaceae bacterium]